MKFRKEYKKSKNQQQRLLELLFNTITKQILRINERLTVCRLNKNNWL